MALAKVLKAKKKWQHERKRKQHAVQLKRQKLVMEKRRRELLDIRRGQLKRRKDEISYVEALEGEVINGDNTSR